jgi:hypothetical protein
MRTVLTLCLVAVTLVLPAAARAGCMATAGLAPPPDGLDAGERWNARLSILQHGVRPLDGLRPRITIVNAATGDRTAFAARPAGAPGEYRASVVFPSGGTWRYEVWDGFTHMDGSPVPCARTHTFASVTIGGPAAGGDAGAPPAPAVAPAAEVADDGPPLGRVALLAALGGIVFAGAIGLAFVLTRRDGGRHARVRAG